MELPGTIDIPTSDAEADARRIAVMGRISTAIDPRSTTTEQAEAVAEIFTTDIASGFAALLMLARIGYHQLETHYGQPAGYYAEMWRELGQLSVTDIEAVETPADLVEASRILARMGYTDEQIELMGITQDADPGYIGEPGQDIPNIGKAFKRIWQAQNGQTDTADVDPDDLLSMAQRAHNGSSQAREANIEDEPGIAGMQLLNVSAAQAERLAGMPRSAVEAAIRSAVERALAELSGVPADDQDVAPEGSSRA